MKYMVYEKELFMLERLDTARIKMDCEDGNEDSRQKSHRMRGEETTIFEIAVAGMGHLKKNQDCGEGR